MGCWIRSTFSGIVNTFNHVCQQLYAIDLRTDYTKLDVPVYFFLGRHDVNAPTALAEQYVQALDAPEKRIVWFEHSGHNPWINEPDKFVREVLACFSKQNRKRNNPVLFLVLVIGIIIADLGLLPAKGRF